MEALNEHLRINRIAVGLQPILNHVLDTISF